MVDSTNTLSSSWNKLADYYKNAYLVQANKTARLQKTEFLLRKYIDTHIHSRHHEDSAEILTLKKEIRRLKNSLHKVYEKYIRPRSLNGIYKVSGKGSSIPDAIDGVPVVEGDRILWTESPLEITISPEFQAKMDEAKAENDNIWKKLNEMRYRKLADRLYTRVLFVSDDNGHSSKDKSFWLVKIKGAIDPKTLHDAELQQIGLGRSGGSWIKIMKDLNLEYELISSGKLSQLTPYNEGNNRFHIRFNLTSGNY